ncbi:hypothetical protein [Nocardioides convexus]|uniref:hypothetical protein n=1 Tax=Nocardioides convexus TaxID=2712224 RepID=UPI00241850BD|nr:hypothetical protein [Nocardioides convexus]
MSPRTLLLRAALPVALLLLATACGPLLDGAEGRGSEGPDTDVPSIADVTPLADPRTWRGEVDINLPEPDIRPVEDDPAPTLPVTVTDAQGTRVRVTDASRILALDIYGTLSQTVFESRPRRPDRGPRRLLGVRRDRGPPAGHPERPRAQCRGDPGARPDGGRHRHLARAVGRAAPGPRRGHPGRGRRQRAQPRQPRAADPAGGERARRPGPGRGARPADRAGGDRRARRDREGRSRRRDRQACG